MEEEKKFKVLDYIIKPETNAQGRFNLYKEVISNTGKKREDAVAYAINLRRVVDIISTEVGMDNSEVKNIETFLDAKAESINLMLDKFNLLNKGIYERLSK
jgi:hypothetical protein